MVRVRCEGTIPALAPYVASDTDMGKNVFSQTKCGPVIRENNISGKQNILGQDKTYKGKGKKVNKEKKVNKYSCPWTMFLSDHIIKSLATNPDILVRAVQDQMQKQFEVGVSKIKAFREKRIATDKMTGSFREQPPKKRKKAYDEIASEICSSGKLSRKGNSVKCSKYGNLGHNTKGYRGQGGASQAGGSSQAGARQAASARNVSGQAAGSSQAGARQAVGARNVSGQAAGARNALASHSYIYPLGIAEDVLVDVAGYVYPVDFVILDIREDKKGLSS
ncbi:hypothetical protein Tco_1291260 [Tanacetum coccineum]